MATKPVMRFSERGLFVPCEEIGVVVARDAFAIVCRENGDFNPSLRIQVKRCSANGGRGRVR